jgi:hypothetical protein
MALRLTSSSSQRLTRTFPLTTYPFTVGYTQNPYTAGAGGGVWGLDDGILFTIMADHRATQWGFYNGISNNSIGDSQTYGRYYYTLIRCIAADNLWMAILNPDGSVTHNNITTTTPAIGGPITEFIGQNINFASAWFNGTFAEYFLTSSDVQGNGAQTNETLLRQIAYRGPFSVPRIKKDIIEYRSFRSRVQHALAGEVYFGSRGQLTWTNNNGVTVGPHPPWAYPSNKRYIRPRQRGIITPLFVTDTAATVTVALTGTITTATEADIRTGGKTIILTVTNDTWVASGATFNAQRAAIIAGIDSAQAEAAGWDAVVKAGLAVGDVVRTSDTIVTITLPAFASFNITATETVTATVPAAALTSAGVVVASPTFTVAVVPFATITGTAVGCTEADIVAGGKTVIITLDSDTWVAAGATFDAQRQNIINGMDSAQAEATGWDAVVKAGLAVTTVVRTSDTVVTVTLSAFATYDITARETITVTVPSTALTAASALVATPTFDVFPTAAAGGGGGENEGFLYNIGGLLPG